MTLNRFLAERVRSWRREHRLTQTEFAEQMGLGRSMLSALERGNCHWTARYIEAAAAAFEVEVVELLDGYQH
ncbi:helix-turn-helix domain-containing protein [Myxococcota bacterium]|nr:helix-turn-helix domain-containing protein [Myxococcota bacterium]